MLENLAAPDLAFCGLPQAWAGRSAWTVLDTDCQDGRLFLDTWRAWQRDPQRPRILHYVAIAQAAPNFANVAAWSSRDDDLPQGWHALVEQCAQRGPGFHRILLGHASVSLTLCLGAAHAMLGEHAFQADTVFGCAPGDKWGAQLLARRCKRGSRFCLHLPVTPDPSPHAHLPALMQAAGFQLEPPGPLQGNLKGRFDPRWDIPTSRGRSDHVAPVPARCAVVGAGVAGASVAHALAQRGWQVSVFDQEVFPAGGASGLPAGLAVPHVSADDNPRSRLSRSGTRLLVQHAEQLLLRGQDWDPSGVLEHRTDGDTLWHPLACWIKPATLVRAWLARPGVTFVGQTKVSALRRTDGHWLLEDDCGQGLGGFDVVVLANAMGSAALLKGLRADGQLGSDLCDKLAALQAVHGTLSHGTYAEAIAGLPATPVNGNGCFVPHVPGAHGEQWFAGATFETDARAAADQWAQHAANMARLRKLLPLVGEFDLAETLDRGPVTLWSATRCVTHDRLPLVGPIDTVAGPGLWLCVGMGSRGLSFSALCAELLVAQLAGEPLPVEFSLSASLNVNRPRRKPSVHRD